MTISKARLIKEKERTGYRVEIIEKVVWLIDILDNINDDSFLKQRLVLKGGTALNVFYLDLPRLSVDIDLNYIGETNREKMLEERPRIEKRIGQIVERMGLSITRNPKEHAGGKMRCRYPSALGNQGNIEIDLNFMYREPLFPIQKLDSVTLCGKQVKAFPVLEIHELAAGKLTALIERKAGRDFFDADAIFNNKSIDYEKLRLVFTLYSAMCTKKNLLDIKIEDITVDQEDLKNKLIPVMSSRFDSNQSSMDKWIDSLLKNIQEGFLKLLPFSKVESNFIHAVRSGSEIPAELLTKNSEMVETIRTHPALLWVSKTKKHKS
jgi:predicted nucleotidyltransferase component of viral defense system